FAGQAACPGYTSALTARIRRARSLYPGDVPGDAADAAAPAGPWAALAPLPPALAGAFRLLRPSRPARQPVGACRVRRRSECRGAADPRACAGVSACTRGRHHGDADGFGAGAPVVWRQRVPRLPAV